MVRPLQVGAPVQTVEVAPPAGASDLRAAGLLAALAAGAVVFWLLPLGIAPQAHKALAVGLFMIAAWMTQVLDHGISGILGCFLFWTFGAARFETAFSGFADTSAWFLFGAVCFGLMVGKSGLARRLAFAVMRTVGHSYPRLLLGLIISNFLLTPVVPSITARGAIEKFGGVPVLWSQWALAYLPCDIIVMIVAWRLALRMYPPETATLPGGSEYLQREIRALGQWTGAEKRAAVLMTIGISLWV